MGRSNRQVTRHRNRLSMAFVLVIGLLLSMTATVGAAPSDNPFVGSWESYDYIVYSDPPFVDDSHSRMQISPTGRWQLRDDGGSVCRNNGYGFVPVIIVGSGEFGDGVFDGGSPDVYCFSPGRTLIDVHPFVDFIYNAVSDTLFGTGTCWWRTGVGDQSDCGE